MFLGFFVKRPVLALVLLFVIIMAGGVAALTLAVWHYLQAPLPTVVVSASYPGANAQMVANTVGKPIEGQIDGVEGMLSMSRQCTDDGAYRLTITFRRGTDLNMAQVLVQNRIALALPGLPEVVNLNGVSVTKQPTR